MTEPRYIKDAPLALRAAERDRRRKMEEQVTQWGTDNASAPIGADAEHAAFGRWLDAELPAGCVSDIERGWMARAALASAATAPIGADALSREEIEQIEAQVWNLRYMDDEERAENHKFACLIAAALASAAQPAVVPPGYMLVPVKPTAEMLQAILSEGEADVALDCAPELRGLLIERAGVPQRYTAMLAAAARAAKEGDGNARTVD